MEVQEGAEGALKQEAAAAEENNEEEPKVVVEEGKSVESNTVKVE